MYRFLDKSRAAHRAVDRGVVAAFGLGYRLGVNAYVVKPVDFEQFVAAVKEVGMFWAVVNEPPPESAGGR